MPDEKFAVGSTITWLESIWEADNSDGCVKCYITGIVKRITPYTVVVEINRDGTPVDHRFSKYQIAEGVGDWELEQAIMETVGTTDKPEDTREHVVYTLSDPRDNTVHYVGISKNVKLRLKQHLTCSGLNLEKNIWVLQLIQQGLQPELTIIETIIGLKDARRRESYRIEQYISQGAPLTNKPNTMEEFFKGYGTDEWNLRNRGSV